MSRKVLAFVLAAFAALIPATGTAQVATGIITGVVRDSSGAAVPGATVRVTSETTCAAVEAVTDEQGAYRTPALASGNYQVTTALDGFEAPVNQVQLRSGETVTINVTLTPSRLSAHSTPTTVRLRSST